MRVETDLDWVYEKRDILNKRQMRASLVAATLVAVGLSCVGVSSASAANASESGVDQQEQITHNRQFGAAEAKSAPASVFIKKDLTAEQKAHITDSADRSSSNKVEPEKADVAAPISSEAKAKNERIVEWYNSSGYRSQKLIESVKRYNKQNSWYKTLQAPPSE